MTIRRCCLLVSAFVLLVMSCLVQGFEPLKGGEAQQLAAKLIKQAEDGKLFLLPWKPASKEADGLSAKGAERLIVVPREALKENTVDPAVKTDQGAILGCVFIPARFQPMVNDKKVDTSRLPLLKTSGMDGKEQQCLCLQLAVKLHNKDEWRLLVYGKEKTPLLETPFEAIEQPSSDKLSLQITEKNGEPVQLHVRVFGKYESSFAISH